jgi:putative tryptophan/tyrosine transport system substrate-binding protein
MRRREFLLACGGAAIWPFAVFAQQSDLRTVGFLSSLGQNDRPNLSDAFRRGLSETGFVEGRNVAIEYRFAENQTDRLSVLCGRSRQPQGGGDGRNGRRRGSFGG